MILVCSASFGAMICFYLLLSVVPQYATSIGASGIGAGFATGALMLSTVAAEIDPFAEPAIALNSAANGVYVEHHGVRWQTQDQRVARGVELRRLGSHRVSTRSRGR